MKKLKDLIRKHNLYLVSGTLLVGLVLLTGKVLLPYTIELVEMSRALDETRENLHRLVTKRKALEGVPETTLKLFGDAEIALPQEKDVASVLTSLENLAKTTSFVVNGVGFTPGVISTPSAQTAGEQVPVPPPAGSERKGALLLSVNVTGQGTTEQFLEFVRQVQGSRRVFDIEAMQVGMSAENQDAVNATFTLVAYYLPGLTQIGSVESELPKFSTEEEAVLQGLSRLPDMSSTLLGGEPLISPAQLGKTNLFTR